MLWVIFLPWQDRHQWCPFATEISSPTHEGRVARRKEVLKLEAWIVWVLWLVVLLESELESLRGKSQHSSRPIRDLWTHELSLCSGPNALGFRSMCRRLDHQFSRLSHQSIPHPHPLPLWTRHWKVPYFPTRLHLQLPRYRHSIAWTKLILLGVPKWHRQTSNSNSP